MRQGFNVDGGIHEIPVPSVPGRLWLCGKHAVAPDPAAVLRALDATTVVCLTERRELIDRYPEYVSWLEQADRRTAVWFPVHDLHAPPLDRARPFLDDLLERLQAGAGLVVHCAAGIGRTGTTATALLVMLGSTVDDALACVRRHRPMAGPEVGSQLDLVRALAEDQPPRRA